MRYPRDQGAGVEERWEGCWEEQRIGPKVIRRVAGPSAPGLSADMIWSFMALAPSQRLGKRLRHLRERVARISVSDL